MKELMAACCLVVSFGGPGEAQAAAAGAASDRSDPANPPQDEAAESEGGLTDIVVTAERRETPLQKTPVAVTGLDQAAIEARNISDLNGLSGMAPSLISPGLSSQRTVNVFYIRGIGEQDTTQNPSVGIYIDDVYIPRAIGAIYTIPDLSSVEILRGPQGTLFGRNTSAGLINIKTMAPSDTPKGTFELKYGSYNDIWLRGVVAGPVSNTVTAELGFIHRTRDGYVHSVTLDRDLNTIDTDALRAKLRWAPSDAFSAELRVDGVQDNSTSSVYAPRFQPNGAGSAPYDPDKTWVSVYPGQYLAGGGVSLVNTYKVDDHLTVKSISSFRKFYNRFTNVNDGGTSYIFNESFTKVKNRTIQQEVQAIYSTDRLNLVGGLFYINEHNDMNRVPWSGGSTVNVGTTTYIMTTTRTDSYAAYAQADYRLLDRLFLTLGARYSRDHTDYTNLGFRVPTTFDNSGPQDVPATVPANATGKYDISASRTWEAFTPKVQARVQWTPDIMTYASYSNGYKAGGFDPRATTALSAAQPFDPEHVDNFELGFKGTFLRNRIRANLALFRNDFRDLQITSYDAANFIFRRINAANARTQGAEFELTALPAPRLEITGMIAFLDTEYTEFDSKLPSNTAGVTTLKGLDLPFAPRWTQNVTINYEAPLAGGRLDVSANVNHRSSISTDIYNTEQLRSPAQYIVNGNIFWTNGAGNWSIGAEFDNLFNNRGNQGGSYSPTSGPAVLVATGGQQVFANNPPRFIRGVVRYKF
ncbi:TonB-dependent receptor [Sphingomonas sp. DT-204]|uniref:TonB-dependent receptor n=1 Tax=Sphingomonas sp. DT-204 TaxID=3396166 RepID=UPI003F1D318D